MLTLGVLLDRTLVPTWDRLAWFQEVDLQGNVLLVPDKAVGSFIANGYGARFREHISDLQIRVRRTQPRRSPTYNQRLRDEATRQQGLL